MKTKYKAMLASYVRAAITSAATVVAVGQWSYEGILKAAVAGLIPVFLRWVNKNDTAYGRGSFVASEA